MSVETDFRALLAGHAGTAALAGTRIAQDVAPEGAALPLVLFNVRHDRTLGLNGDLLADQCAIDVQCWADTAAGAAALADAVTAAVATAPAQAGAVVVARATSFDADQGADVVQLAVEWWG